MTWEIIAIIFLVVGSNIGQSYFTTYRLTDFDFVKSIFRTETRSDEIVVKTLNLDGGISQILRDILDLKQKVSLLQDQSKLASQGYEQLYTLIMRGSVIKLDELIDSRYSEKIKLLEKREHDITDLAKKIEEYGKTILKK